MKRNPKCLLSIVMLTFLCAGSLWSQTYLYYMSAPPFTGGTNLCTLGQVSIDDCEPCAEFSVPCGTDLVVLPNGQVLVVNSSSSFTIYDPPNPTPVSTFDLPASNVIPSPVVLSPSGTVYYFTYDFVESCLNEYDPATNSSTVLGCAPGSELFFELFFWNGQLYGLAQLGANPPDYGIFSIDIASPLNLTLIENYSLICEGPWAAVPGVGIFNSFLPPACANSASNFENFDLFANTSELVCELGSDNLLYGLSNIPPGFPPPPATCGCETEAGEVSTTNNALCTGEDFDFDNTGSELEPDDALQYILFADLADTLGSILLTNNLPSFSFSDPPLETGVTYYVAAIAGNELSNGDIDLTDPCLDISNVLEVVWNPLPTVEFIIVNPDVCQGDCTDVEVTLTGTPPFSLTYDTPGNAGQSANFSNLTETLEVCVPGNAAPGSFSLQAVTLEDANCSCL